MSERSREFLKEWRLKTYGAQAEKIIADIKTDLEEHDWKIPCRAYHYLCSALIVKLFYSLPEVFKKAIIEHLTKRLADSQEGQKSESESTLKNGT